MIKQTAFKILARREYSRAELLRKLHQKFPEVDADTISEVLKQLTAKNFQNDERYAESMIRHRANQGYGPNYIRQSLKMQGISDSEISRILADSECDWFEIAAYQYSKHFGGKPIKDMKEKARRMRYLYSRGFSQEIIQKIIK